MYVVTENASQAELMEKELEERLRAEKATPTAPSSSSSSSGSVSSPLGGIGSRQRSKSSQQGGNSIENFFLDFRLEKQLDIQF